LVTTPTLLHHFSYTYHFSQEEQKVCHLIQHSHPTEGRRSSEAQRKTITHRGRERQAYRDRYTGVPVHELNEMFQTPEAAFQTADEKTGKSVPVVQILQNNPERLYYSQDQRTKCQRTCVEPRIYTNPFNTRQHRTWGYILGQGALSQGDGEVHQPEEHQQVAQLQHEDVAVVEALATVESKGALGARADLCDVGLTERLGRGTGY
uniref:Uncharacterized protein n=1 Tax=Esox lucius TaxID=8010 RepID=A0A3P9A5Y0_ESOLU